MREPDAAPPTPVADPARLAALDALSVLDTPPEQGFDDVVRLATRLCAAPVALVSLVAADRQWFKARVGFPHCETDLNASVCAHALAEPDLLILPDLTADPRTAANPLVTGEPFIRFYAGAPLRLAGGQVVGSLCVIDTVPRPEGLTPEQADDLRALGRQVGERLEMRRALGARDALLAEQEAARRERQLLARTQAAIASAGGDLDTVLDLVAAAAMEAVPAAEGAAVELLVGEELEYRATKGVLAPHRGLRVAFSESLAGLCVRTGEPMLAGDVLRGGQVRPYLAERLGLRSAVLAPIRRGDRVLGVLKLQAGPADAFVERDLDVARLFAGAATIGLTEIAEAEADSARRRAQDRLDLLSRISAALLTATDPARAVEPLLAAGAASLGFEQSFLYDLDPDGRHLRLTQSVGVKEEVRAALCHVDLDGPLCGIVARTGRPFVLTAVQATDEPRYAMAREVGINAFAGYPVTSRGATVGVVSFCAAGAPAFDEGALGFFETVARYLSAVRERVDGEAALRESDARSQRAQAAGQVGTYEVDVASGLISVSPEFARIYGRPPTGPYAPEAFETLALAEDRHLVSTSESREAGTVIPDVEYRIRRADDGAVRWVARHASLARDGAGRVTTMSGTVQDVTEKRAAQDALRESEERFRTILDTVEAAFAIVEVKFDADDRPVDYRFVEANPAFERQAGVNLRGKWVTEFAPDLEQFWFDTYGRVAKTGEPATFENYAEAFKRWFDVRAVRIGRPEERRIAILFSDVTARKQAEADLRASEALARANVERVQLALAAGAIIGTWHWDLPSDRFTVDEAFARSFGLDPALGREGIPLARIVATVHPDDQAGLAGAINEVISRGGAYAHQYRVRRADGRYYWIEANGRVDKAEDGTPLSFPGVLLDVEERRAAQEALRESEGRFRALVTAGNQTVYRMSPDWQKMRALDGAGFLIDTKAPSVRWLDLYIDPADRPGVLAAIEDAIRRRSLFELEHRVFRADGTLGWTLSRAVPVLDARGEVVEWFGAASDVTERKRAEDRQVALIDLGDRLRETADPDVMAYAAAEILGRTLRATRAGYGTVDVARETVTVDIDWTAPGHASVKGLHRFRDYGTYLDDLRRGETVMIADVAEDPRTRDRSEAMAAIEVRTLAVAPLVEHGVLVALLFVHHDRPRALNTEEFAFVRNVADRTRAGIARVRAEEERTLLTQELSHRLKNTLSMVISIAGQTLRTVPDRAPVEAFESRIHALSQAHDVLLRQSWAAAPAKEVVRAVLAGAGHGDRVAVSGPDLDLGPRATLSLSLLLHELATNAAKYGALSVPSGHIEVDWRLEGEGEGRGVALDWTERGGPPPTPPARTGRKGFGSRLIQMGLVGTGDVDLRYPASGFQATMRASLVELQQS